MAWCKKARVTRAVWEQWTGFTDAMTGDDAWAHRDGFETCATPRPRRLLGSEA